MALARNSIHLSASRGLKVFTGDAGSFDTDYVEVFRENSLNWGIQGKNAGSTIFSLGGTNQIAGWKFDSSKIISNNGENSQESPGIIINSNGTIETDPFISGLTANATGWQIRSDGRAEFENAVIRGTLSTAVFEKDTVSVVGGQVMIANAAKTDNPETRFVDYPVVKSSAGEDIHFSGEELPPVTLISNQNDAQNGSGNTFVVGTNTNMSANNVLDGDLWFKFDGGGNDHVVIQVDSGSIAGKQIRLSFYAYANFAGFGDDGVDLFFATGSVGVGTTGTYLATSKYIGGGLIQASSFGFPSIDIANAANSGEGVDEVTAFHKVYYDVPTNISNAVFLFSNVGDNTYYLRDIHLMITSQSLDVDNAGGFVNGEILVAKSTDQGPDGREGFVREYMRVVDTDLGTSETPASGTFDFGSIDIDENTNLIVTASKFYTFTGTTTNQADEIANNQYYFPVGSTKAESLGNIKSKINAEVQDMFVNTTGSVAGTIDQLYMQAVDQGTDGNSYGMQTGSTSLKLSGAVNRIKPTLTVERNLDALVEGNGTGYFISKLKDGQSMASQGALNTGYILLNAQPTDTNTPYIDIVERTSMNTGSQQHTGDDADSVFGIVKTVARLGDLSGITDDINGTAVSGYGLYTDNAFLRGGIVATYGTVGTLNIGSQSISITDSGASPFFNTSTTKFFVSGSGRFSLGNSFAFDPEDSSLKVVADSFNMGNASAFISGSNGKLRIKSTNFNVLTNGSVSMTGTINATGGTIGGWNIEDSDLRSTTTLPDSSNPTIFLRPVSLSESEGNNDNRMLIGVGPRNDFFGEDDEGRVFNVTDTGAVTSSALLVQDTTGNKLLDTTNLSLDSGNNFRNVTIPENIYSGINLNKLLNENESSTGPFPGGDGNFTPQAFAINMGRNYGLTTETIENGLALSTGGWNSYRPQGVGYGLNAQVNDDYLYFAGNRPHTLGIDNNINGMTYIPEGDDFLVMTYIAAVAEPNLNTNASEQIEAPPIAIKIDISAFDVDALQSVNSNAIVTGISPGQIAQAGGIGNATTYSYRLNTLVGGRGLQLDAAGYGFDNFPSANGVYGSAVNRWPIHAPGILVIGTDGISDGSVTPGAMDFDNEALNDLKQKFVAVSIQAKRAQNNASAPAYNDKILVFKNINLFTCGKVQLNKLIEQYPNSVTTYYTGSGANFPAIRNYHGTYTQ